MARGIVWKTFADLEEALENIPQLMQRHDFTADVYEEKDAVIVEMHLAGVQPDHVEIEVDDNILTVRGSRKKIDEFGDRHYYRQEIYRGSFERTVVLPVPVAGDRATAAFEHGVLIVHIPKEHARKPHKISIKSKNAS